MKLYNRVMRLRELALHAISQGDLTMTRLITRRIDYLLKWY